MKIKFRIIRGEEARQNWLSKVKDGRNAFVLKTGILRWGVPVNVPTLMIFARKMGLASGIMYFLVFTIVSGTAFGLAVWYMNCWLYSVD